MRAPVAKRISDKPAMDSLAAAERINRQSTLLAAHASIRRRVVHAGGLPRSEDIAGWIA